MDIEFRVPKRLTLKGVAEADDRWRAMSTEFHAFRVEWLSATSRRLQGWLIAFSSGLLLLALGLTSRWMGVEDNPLLFRILMCTVPLLLVTFCFSAYYDRDHWKKELKQFLEHKVQEAKNKEKKELDELQRFDKELPAYLEQEENIRAKQRKYHHAQQAALQNAQLEDDEVSDVESMEQWISQAEQSLLDALEEYRDGVIEIITESKNRVRAWDNLDAQANSFKKRNVIFVLVEISIPLLLAVFAIASGGLL